MHISLSPVFSKSIHVLGHHKILTLLAIFVTVLIVVASLSQSILVNQAPTAEAVSGSSNIIAPFTLLDDPHYAHEYERRAQDVLTHLNLLKDQTQADRAYVVSYSGHRIRFGTMVALSKIFEIGQIKVLKPVSSYQGFSRMGWLYFKQYQTMISGLYPPDEFPQGYGTELYDGDGKAIGYLGIDYRQGFPISQVNEMTLLRQTAAAITMSLLQPLEPVSSWE